MSLDSWRILRSKGVETAALRAWALGIAARRGKRIAVVALARRRAGIVYAMWRDGRPYDATQLPMPVSFSVRSAAATLEIATRVKLAHAEKAHVGHGDSESQHYQKANGESRTRLP